MGKIKDILLKKEVAKVKEPHVEPEIKGGLYAFYGSLRKGQYNYTRTGLPKETYIKTVQIEGYEMYSLGAFPLVVQSSNKKDVITVDLFAIANENLQRGIHLMEIGAGYERIAHTIDGKDYYLYVYSRANKGLQRVTSGDWAEWQANLVKNQNALLTNLTPIPWN